MAKQSARERMRKESRKKVDAIFALSGFNVSKVWELANQYWPNHPDYDDVRSPWWLFSTDIGLIQIGRRKRVWHIQWDTCTVRGIVTGDEVTKEDTYVHAYSEEKAIEYLKSLRSLSEQCIARQVSK